MYGYWHWGWKYFIISTFLYLTMTFLSVPAWGHTRKLFVSKCNWPQEGLIAWLRQKIKGIQKGGQKTVAIKIDSFLSIDKFYNSLMANLAVEKRFKLKNRNILFRKY